MSLDKCRCPEPDWCGCEFSFDDGFKAGLEAAANYVRSHMLIKYRCVENYDRQKRMIVDEYVPSAEDTANWLADQIAAIEVPE